MCLVVTGFIFLSSLTAYADTFTVTSLDDSGPGTLRAAIEKANENQGADTIEIEAVGTIELSSYLPSITDPVTIYPDKGVTIKAPSPSGESTCKSIFEVRSDDVTIEKLTLYSENNEMATAVSVYNAKNVTIDSNVISMKNKQCPGILFSGSTGSIKDNKIEGNDSLFGILITPYYGDDVSPDNFGDDKLSEVEVSGNTFSSKLMYPAIEIRDESNINDVRHTFTQNTFGMPSVRSLLVKHTWRGTVELLHGYGGNWSAVDGGQVVTVTTKCGDTVAETTLDVYSSSNSSPNLGTWGANGFNYNDVRTWPVITSEFVNWKGKYYSCEHTVVTSGNYSGSTKFSFDGNSKTDPVDPDYGLPFTNDKNSTTEGRYQIAQILFYDPPPPTPTPTLTPTPAGYPASIPEPSTFLLIMSGITGIGLWYEVRRQKRG